MAAIRDTNITQLTVEAASITVPLPVHATDDLLLVFVAKDASKSGTWSEIASTGWTIGGDLDNSTNMNLMWAYKKATSASETNPNFSQGDVDSIIAIAISVKGVHTTLPIDVSGGNGSLTTGSGKETITGLTTVNANALCFYVLGESVGTGPTPEPGLQTLISDDTATVGLGVGWSIQKTAGLAPNHVFYCNTAAALLGVQLFVAVRDDGGGTLIPPYHDRGTTLGIVLQPLTGTNYPYGGSWQATTVAITSIGGQTVTQDAITSTADIGVNPFHAASRLTPTASTTNLGGTTFNLAAATDLSAANEITLGTFQFTTPRDYIDTGFVSDGGIQIAFADASNNYTSWMIGAQRAKTTKSDNRNYYAIQIAQTTATRHAQSATPPSLSAITKFQIQLSPELGAGSHNFSQLVRVNKAVVAGGTTTEPVSFEGLLSVVNGYVMPFSQTQGEAAVLVYCPVQIGGSQAVTVDASNFSIQFPRTASESSRFLDFHVDKNIVGLIFDCRLGDVCKLRNAVIQSPSPFKFEFLSTVSTSATWDFDGLTLIGATPTLRNIGTSETAGFRNMTFISCDQIVQNSGTITGCTIQTTTHATSALFSTDLAKIKKCSFVNNNNGDIGHSIEITMAGTYTFDGNTFSGGGVAKRSFNTGTGVDSVNDIITTDTTHGYVDGDAVYYQDQGGVQTIGLTDGTIYYVNSQTTATLSFHTTKANAITDTSRVNLTSAGSETHYIYSAKADLYNNSTGAVSINVTNGGATPTIRESNGSSTTVNNAVNITITVKDEAGGNVQNARVAVYKSSDMSELMNSLTNASGVASTSVNYVSDIPVIIRVRKSSATPKYIPVNTSGTVISTGLTATVTFVTDSIAAV